MPVSGVRKFGAVGLLAAINAGLVGLWLGYLDPQVSELGLRSRSLRTMADGIHNAHGARAEEFERMKKSRNRYNDLLDRGFVSPQDRLGAAKLLEELRETHGLSLIRYEIAPEKLIGDRTLRNTGYWVVSTRITVFMQAMFDTNVIDFAQGVVERFPGQVRVISLTLRQLARPTAEILEALRNGDAVDFAASELVFEWNTLRPIETQQQGQSS